MTLSEIEQRETEWETLYDELYKSTEKTGFDFINGVWYEDWASDMATRLVWGSYEAMEEALSNE